MRRLSCLATAWLVLAAFSRDAAAEKYTFGEVPPPAKFPGAVDHSRATPAGPGAVPPQVKPKPVQTNSVPPKDVAPVIRPRVEVPKPIAIAPPVVKPEPVVENAAPAAPKSPPPVRPPGPLVVKPGGGISGKVMMADARGRFVILNFPFGQMPAVNAALDVFRHGVKVGEIKITGPQRDDNTAADVISGELQTGDVARQR